MTRDEAIANVYAAMFGGAGAVSALLRNEDLHDAALRRARAATELVDGLAALGLLKLDDVLHR